jgi:hypothetical protein
MTATRKTLRMVQRAGAGMVVAALGALAAAGAYAEAHRAPDQP